jgi:hypothetical protein
MLLKCKQLTFIKDFSNNEVNTEVNSGNVLSKEYTLAKHLPRIRFFQSHLLNKKHITLRTVTSRPPGPEVGRLFLN